MKSKDKKKRIVRITLKNIIAFCVFNISILYIVIFYNFYFSRNDVYAKETSSKIENIKISEAKPLDIESIIAENTKENQREEYIIEETEL